MAERTKSGGRTVCEGWSQAMTDALRYQWWLYDLQYRAGLKLLNTLVPAHERPDTAATPAEGSGTTGESPPACLDELRDLERRAWECVRRGVALPREVYDIRNRRRIDWSAFPEWARPVDPDVFAGSAHEG